MTAATITHEPDGLLAKDHVLLTLSDGETYVSKLSKVYGAVATWNEDIAAATAQPTIAISGRTLTFTAGLITDKKIFVTCYGRK